MDPAPAADSAVKGLTSWEEIAKMVTAFGGGPAAVCAIAIIAVAVVAVIVSICTVAYLTFRSHNRTKVQIARINRKVSLK
jgi:hypothetical protein